MGQCAINSALKIETYCTKFCHIRPWPILLLGHLYLGVKAFKTRLCPFQPSVDWLEITENGKTRFRPFRFITAEHSGSGLRKYANEFHLGHYTVAMKKHETSFKSSFHAWLDGIYVILYKWEPKRSAAFWQVYYTMLLQILNLSIVHELNL